MRRAAALTSGERPSIRAFFDTYRAAFEAFDAAAIADLFSYPCQITSGDPEIAVTTIGSGEVWVAQMERLVAAYRAIGVRSAEALEVQWSSSLHGSPKPTSTGACATGKGKRSTTSTPPTPSPTSAKACESQPSPTTRLPVSGRRSTASGSHVAPGPEHGLPIGVVSELPKVYAVRQAITPTRSAAP